MLSSPDDHRLPLRFAGLLYGNTSMSVCCNSGIYTGGDVLKMILAGADCVQIVSTIIKNTPAIINGIIQDILIWMRHNKVSSLNEIRVTLSDKVLNDPFIYKRGQYIDLLMNKSEEVIHKHRPV